MRRSVASLWKVGCILAILAALILAFERVYAIRFFDTSFATGWALFALVILLGAYGLRERFPIGRFGPSAAWLRFHEYAALLSGVLFLSHLRWRLPSGTFEGILAVAYAIVFFSGLLGWFLLRTIPRRLASHGEEIVLERIPAQMRRLRGEVEQIVHECASESGVDTMVDFYFTHLEVFFERPRHFVRHLIGSSRPCEVLLLAVRGQERYLGDRERASTEAIAECLRRKDDLDHQFALSVTLRAWSFIHVPFACALLVFATFHVILVHSFTGV